SWTSSRRGSTGSPCRAAPSTTSPGRRGSTCAARRSPRGSSRGARWSGGRAAGRTTARTIPRATTPGGWWRSTSAAGRTASPCGRSRSRSRAPGRRLRRRRPRSRSGTEPAPVARRRPAAARGGDDGRPRARRAARGGPAGGSSTWCSGGSSGARCSGGAWRPAGERRGAGADEERMSGSGPRDAGASGDAYEPYVGRWSRLAAREFLRWLALPAGGRWLDVGCGTGAVTRTILEVVTPARVDAVDRSDAYVAHARAHAADPRAHFAVDDAQVLAVEPGAYDAAVSGLVLNFVPDPARMVAAMARAVRPGGTVALYVWDYAGEMQLMRIFWDAAVALDPAARELDEGVRFPVCRAEPLGALFAGA